MAQPMRKTLGNWRSEPIWNLRPMNEYFSQLPAYDRIHSRGESLQGVFLPSVFQRPARSGNGLSDKVDSKGH
jgi:hypothetical protein